MAFQADAFQADAFQDAAPAFASVPSSGGGSGGWGVGGFRAVQREPVFDAAAAAHLVGAVLTPSPDDVLDDAALAVAAQLTDADDSDNLLTVSLRLARLLQRW